MFFADSRLFARASLDFHLYFSSVQGLGGGVMTSMRMRIMCCVSLVDLVLVRGIDESGRGGWGGGGVVTSMRMRLLCCVSLVVLCFVHWWGDGGMGAFRFGFAVFSERFRAVLCRPSTCGIYFHVCVCVFDLRAGVGRGGDGLMTSMRMRLTCTVPLSALCIDGYGGMLMMLMLFRVMLIAYAEHNNGDGYSYGNNNLVVTLFLRRHQYKNTRVF